MFQGYFFLSGWSSLPVNEAVPSGSISALKQYQWRKGVGRISSKTTRCLVCLVRKTHDSPHQMKLWLTHVHVCLTKMSHRNCSPTEVSCFASILVHEKNSRFKGLTARFYFSPSKTLHLFLSCIAQIAIHFKQLQLLEAWKHIYRIRFYVASLHQGMAE